MNSGEVAEGRFICVGMGNMAGCGDACAGAAGMLRIARVESRYANRRVFLNKAKQRIGKGLE
jgi:hypothetical protein